MVSSEARYHKYCYDSLRNKLKSQSGDHDNVNPYDIAFSALISEFYDPLEMGKLYHVSALRDIYENKLIAAGLDCGKAAHYRNSNLKLKLQSYFGNRIVFIPQMGHVSDIICNAEMSAAELLKAWQKLRCDIDENYMPIPDEDSNVINAEDNFAERQMAFRVAQKIKSDLKDVKARVSDDKSESWNVTYDQALSTVPVSLYNLIAFLICDTSFDMTYSEGRVLVDQVPSGRHTSLGTHQKVLNVAQHILYTATGMQTPQHVGLAVYVHHKTRSKDVITVLNRLGLCISYDELQRLLTSVAIQINEQSDNGNVFIPSNIAPNYFTQFAIDNLDFSECTLDGASMHVTSMVMFQPSTQELLHGGSFGKVPTKVTRGRSLHGTPCDVSQSLTRSQPFKTMKRQMTSGKDIDINQLLEHHISEVPNINLCWNLLRLCPTKLIEIEVECPGWKSFQATLFQKHLPVTVIGYCPFQPEPPTNPDVVRKALKICMKASQQLGLKHTVVTQDEAIYEISYTLRKNKPDEYHNLILRLGGFHLLMNYLGAVGGILGGSGLKELFVSGKLLKDGTAEKVLSGKDYYQAVNAHMRVYEALIFLKWEAFEEWLTSQDFDLDIMVEISDLMAVFASRIQIGDRMVYTTVFELERKMVQIKVMIDMFDKSRHAYKTHSFWTNYLEMIEIMLTFIHAERAAIWPEHLSATAQMAEYIAAADHTKYIKAVVSYLEEMKKLPNIAPEVHEEFELGNFTVKRSSGTFNSIWTDMGLECSQNCDAKGRSGQAGLRGVTMNVCAQEKWFRTLPFTAAVSNAMKHMLMLHKTDSPHHEDNNATMKRERESRDNVISTAKTGDMINPFTYNKTDLVCIADGMVATEKVACDVIDSRQRGFQSLQEFITTGKTAKLNLSTFRNLKPGKKSQKSKKDQLVTNEMVSLKRIILEIERGVHNVQLKDALNHELHNYPPAIAQVKPMTTDTSLRSGNKAFLLTVLKQKCGLKEWPVTISDSETKTGIIVDTMALIRTHRPFENELSDNYAQRILKTVIQSAHCDEFHVVADRYDGLYVEDEGLIDISLKAASGCKDRRGESSKEFQICSGHTIKHWDDIVSNSKSKAHLQTFLFEYWSNQPQLTPDGATLILGGGYDDRTVVKIVRPSDLSSSESDNDDDVVKLLSSTQEETDTRAFLHIAACVLRGCSRVILRASDTDIVVIAVYLYERLLLRGLKELYIQTKDYYIPIHEIFKAIDIDETKMLPLLHALSGCDTTSFFYGKSKRSFFNSATQLKSDLASLCVQIENESISDLLIKRTFAVAQLLLVAVYHKDTFTSLNELRQHLYAWKKTVQALPPTDDAFHQHVLRALFQTCIWVRAMQTRPRIPSPLNFGWMSLPSGVQPVLMTKPALPPNMHGNLFCNCKQMCAKSCPCERKRVPCSCRGDFSKCVCLQLDATEDNIE